MRIYTGTGDQGETSLGSGERVAKSDHQVEAYGTVDELNSVLGLVCALLGEDSQELAGRIEEIQSTLFHIGAWAARTPDDASLEKLQRISPAQIEALERDMDRMDTTLPPLTGFILPGGHASAAAAHVARTVCRRAERRMVELAAAPGYAAHLADVLTYLNRLADYLFVLARHLNERNGLADRLWKKPS